MKKSQVLVILFCALFAIFSLTACLDTPNKPTLLPEVTETVEPINTATIQWFPPTSTPTPFPTRLVTPTPDYHPGLGDILVEDDFSDPTQWDLGARSAGSIAFSQQKLTLAVSQASGILYSFRKAPFGSNFYLTMDVSPALCRASDTYGIMFRVNSVLDFYRLLLNCRGLVRLERVRNGEITALQDWLPSGQVPPGSPLDLQVGISAIGSDLRIFINDVYQFGVKDAIFPSGWVGVYARSMGSNALTVNFSNLVIHSIIP